MILLTLSPEHLKKEVEAFEGDAAIVMPVLLNVPTQALQVLQRWICPWVLYELLQADFNLPPKGQTAPLPNPWLARVLQRLVE